MQCRAGATADSRCAGRWYALIEWETRRLVSAGVPINPYLLGYPWKASKHWLDVQINWNDSEVLEDFDPALGPPVWSRLRVGRGSILEIWPRAVISEPDRSAREGGQAGDLGLPAKFLPSGVRTNREANAERACNEWLQQFSDNHASPGKDQAFAQHRRRSKPMAP